jgi:hypothetical protein
VRNEEERGAWRAAVARRDRAQVVFVDVSGTQTALTRLSGGAPQDQRATGSVPRTHGQNTTRIAVLTPDGWQEPWRLIAGAMTTGPSTGPSASRWRRGCDRGTWSCATI